MKYIALIMCIVFFQLELFPNIKDPKNVDVDCGPPCCKAYGTAGTDPIEIYYFCGSWHEQRIVDCYLKCEGIDIEGEVHEYPFNQMCKRWPCDFGADCVVKYPLGNGDPSCIGSAHSSVEQLFHDQCCHTCSKFPFHTCAGYDIGLVRCRLVPVWELFGF